MPDDTKHDPDDSEQLEATDPVASLLKRMGPVIFIRAVESAHDEHERRDYAHAFARSPLTDFKTIETTMKFAVEHDSIAQQEGEAERKIEILPYAKASMNTFLAERTDKTKSGLMFQYMYEGRVIISVGHALNEGVTEMLTHEVMTEYGSKSNPKEEADIEAYLDANGTYLIEVKAANLLCERMRKKVVLGAYFGGMDKYQVLAQAVDEALGKGAWMQLLHLTDSGEWMPAFQILRALPSVEERGD